jgi:hypothetical protein
MKIVIITIKKPWHLGQLLLKNAKDRHEEAHNVLSAHARS